MHYSPFVEFTIGIMSTIFPVTFHVTLQLLAAVDGSCYGDVASCPDEQSHYLVKSLDLHL